MIQALNGNPDAIHLLGDSYAHATKGSSYSKMYPRAKGHLWSKDDPDNIAKHQGQYNKYLDDLEVTIGILSGNNSTADRTVFNIISNNENQVERTDILKGFVANKLGQTYTTASGSRSVKAAFDQLGINCTINVQQQKVFFGLFTISKYSYTVNGSQNNQ